MPRPPWSQPVPTVDGRRPDEVEVAGSGGVRLSGLDWRPEREDGAPFLLVHGLASRSRLWDGVAAALARLGHRAVAVDQRGHGLSDHPDDGYDFPTLAEDLRAWVDQLGLRRPVLAGQSWGASVVLVAGAHLADAVAGVVLVDGGVGALGDAFDDWESARTALAPPSMDGLGLDAFETMFRSRAHDWPESGVVGAMAVVRPVGDGTVAPYLSRERHLRILRHLYELRPVDHYGEVTAPITALLASDGPPGFARLKRDGVQALRERQPRARVHWLDGVHDLHAQQPATVAGVLRDAALHPR